MTRPIAFPWTRDGEGIVSVLSDASLWSAVFSPFQQFCEAFLAEFGKPSRMLPKPLQQARRPWPNVSSFGRLFTDTLNRPAKRQRLISFLCGNGQVVKFRRSSPRRRGQPWNCFLASMLYSHVVEKYPTARLPGDSVYRWEGDSNYLLANEFEAWLRANPIAAADRTILALFVCSFAFLQLSEAPALLSAALRADPDSRSLLLGEGETFEEPATSVAAVVEAAPPPDPAPLPSREPPSPPPPQPAIAASPACCAMTLAQSRIEARRLRDSLLQQCQSSKTFNGFRVFLDALEENAATETIDHQLRELLQRRREVETATEAELARRLADLDARLTGVDEARNKVLGRLTDLTGRPGTTCVRPDEILASLEDLSLEQAPGHLESLLSQAVQAEQASDQVATLAGRLGEQHRGPAAARELGEVVRWLKAEAARLQQVLQTVGEREQEVGVFLQCFRDAGAEQARALVREAAPARWASLLQFITGPRVFTEVGKRFEGAVGDRRCVGPVLAYLWHRHPAEALKLAPSVVTSLPDDDADECLAFLSLDSHFELCKTAPALVGRVCELLFAAFIREAEAPPMDYLELILTEVQVPSPCLQFYQEVVRLWRAGNLTDPAKSFRLAKGAPAEQGLPAPLQMIDALPGMHGNYHRLRSLAHTKFLQPLRDAVAAGDRREAWSRWQAFGDLDEMVRSCVRASGREDELDQPHYTQTRRYLDRFRIELQSWQGGQANVPAALSRLVAGLGRDARRGVEGCQSLWLALERSLAASGFPPVHYAQRCATSRDGDLIMIHALDHLNPLMTWSWPDAVREGSVPVDRVLTDHLRRAAGREPTSHSDAIEEYLAASEFAAARQAAADETQRKRVDQEFARREAAFRTTRSDLLAEAQEARAIDPVVADCLAEIFGALQQARFDLAAEWADLLSEAVDRVRAQRDPERRALTEYLHEGGIEAAETLPVEQLRVLREQIQQTNAERRQYLDCIRKIAETLSELNGVSDKLLALANRLDRPRLWPSDERWFDLAVALEQLEAFFRKRARFLAHARALLESLSEWVVRQLERGIEKGDSEEVECLVKVADKIDDGAPDNYVLELLGQARPGRDSAAEELRPLSLPIPDLVAPVQSEVPNALQAFLDRHLAAEEPLTTASDVDLKAALLAGKWADARRLSAALIQAEAPDRPPDRRHNLQAAYAVALAHSSGPDDRRLAHQQACLALLLLPERLRALYFRSEVADGFFVQSLSVLAGNEAPPSGTAERLGDVLAALVDAGPEDEAFRWCSELFYKASELPRPGEEPPGSCRLAARFWETFKARSKNFVPRSTLLSLLYRMRRYEALEHLTEGLGQLSEHALFCLKAFRKAETDPVVRPRASQGLVAFSQLGEAKPHFLPWVQFFRWLERRLSGGDEIPVVCQPLSDLLVTEGELAIVELRMTPGPSDSPTTLSLEIPGARQLFSLVEPDNPLFKERVVSLRVPVNLLEGNSDAVRLSYRLTGSTLFKRVIDQRESWQLSRPMLNSPALSDAEIRAAWPGVAGDPVLLNRGFCGREKEVRQIEQMLRDPARQLSAMIFGQRRVGKTSLLLRFVESLPPLQGRVCGAFLDVSGLDLQPGHVREAFFKAIVSGLDTKRENQPLRDALPDTVAALARGLSPAPSLCDALTELVRRLREASNRRIDRLALFIDEFDRFVEPFLKHGREEVNQLNWNLRQIVQRSNDLSLFLAGSGLQRLFTQEYENPFYGSIEVIEVGPFDTDREWLAIQDTFMPAPVRERLTRGGHLDEATREAFRLTGGHPWYLAMLGYAVARVSRGQSLTSALVKRAVEVMLDGKIPEGGKCNVRENFYGPTFQSLDRLPPRRRAVARILLAHLAQRTTADYPWLTLSETLEPPSIVRRTTEEERYTALLDLEREQAVEADTERTQARVRIPLTAFAVQRNAAQIAQEATQIPEVHL